MSDAAVEPGFETAITVLREATAALRSRSKTVAPPGVKAEMERITVGGFSHRAFGFVRFSDFLKAAELACAIERVPRPVGEPLIALPEWRDEVPPEPATTVERRLDATPRTRIREDLWQAFIDWSPGMVRAWDREARRAIVIPADPRPLEPADYAPLRVAMTAKPDRFVRLDPISMARQLEWLRGVASALSDHDPEKSQLETWLTTQPERVLSHVRTLPSVYRTWSVVRFTAVRRLIREWALQNGIDQDVEVEVEVEGAPRRPRGASAPAVAAGAVSVSRPEALRDRILASVSRMSLAELLRLPIPAEYLLDL